MRRVLFRYTVCFDGEDWVFGDFLVFCLDARLVSDALLSDVGPLMSCSPLSPTPLHPER